MSFKWFIYALMGLVVTCILGFGTFFLIESTNKFNNDIKVFSVTYNGREVRNNAELDFETQKQHTFKVNYLLGAPKNGTALYSVVIMANPEEAVNFEFKLDHIPYYYFKQGDLTAGFKIKRAEDMFALDFSNGITMQDILKAKHTEGNLEVGDIDLYKSNYFILQIANYDKSKIINIKFKLKAVINAESKTP